MNASIARGSEAGEAAPFRLLVVLCRAAGGGELGRRLGDLAGGRRLDVHLLAPAFAGSHLEFLVSDVDPGIRRARRRLEESAPELGEIADAGEIGEADPLMAIDTALVEFPAEEIVIVPSSERDQWAEAGLSATARARFELPVWEIELLEAEAGIDAARIARVTG